MQKLSKKSAPKKFNEAYLSNMVISSHDIATLPVSGRRPPFARHELPVAALFRVSGGSALNIALFGHLGHFFFKLWPMIHPASQRSYECLPSFLA